MCQVYAVGRCYSNKLPRDLAPIDLSTCPVSALIRTFSKINPKRLERRRSLLQKFLTAIRLGAATLCFAQQPIAKNLIQILPQKSVPVPSTIWETCASRGCHLRCANRREETSGSRLSRTLRQTMQP